MKGAIYFDKLRKKKLILIQTQEMKALNIGLLLLAKPIEVILIDRGFLLILIVTAQSLKVEGVL